MKTNSSQLTKLPKGVQKRGSPKKPSSRTLQKNSPKKKKSRRHPSYKDMIIESLSALPHKNATSFMALAKYLDENYSLPPGFRTRLKTALNKGIEEKVFMKMRNSYKLVEGNSTSNSPRKRISKNKKQKIKSPSKKTKSISSPVVSDVYKLFDISPSSESEATSSPSAISSCTSSKKRQREKERNDLDATQSDEEIIHRMKKRVKRKLF